jgi:cysteine desulfurase
MPSRKAIYLDYNATTPIDPEVADAMEPFLRGCFGNPSSSHRYGAEARKVVEAARMQVAALLECESDEIVFTSGGSESNNLAIKGHALARRGAGGHIITSRIEHPAVLEVCRYLETAGFSVTYLPVDNRGIVDPDDVRRAIRTTTILISIMQANNEVGTIQPIPEICAIAAEKGIAVHTDSAQAVGKIAVGRRCLGADMISVAGHKLYAPKGVGALYVRRGLELEKLIHGAGHERMRRAGTENVLEIVGLGKACEIVSRELERDRAHLAGLRDRLESGLCGAIPGARVNGHTSARLPNTLSISFPGIEASRLLGKLDGIACSAGAACHSDGVVLSHVLEAMAVPPELARGTIRLSVGRMTTEVEIAEAIRLICDASNQYSTG